MFENVNRIKKKLLLGSLIPSLNTLKEKFVQQMFKNSISTSHTTSDVDAAQRNRQKS
jgi:hypothetical protein